MGPPYEQDPDDDTYQFLVISNPWPNSQNFDSVGAWLRFAGRGPSWRGPEDDVLCETIYIRKNEDIVIVKLPDVDISPYLGAHQWANFLRPGAPPEYFSYVFEYNYRNNGDPANHNWSEQCPRTDLPPPQFPVRHPYPPPSYAQRPGSLSSLAKPMPKPAEQVTSQPTSGEPPLPRDNQHRDRDPIVKQEPDVKQEEITLPVQKNDPFEEEEAAANFLRSSGSFVKQEPDDTTIFVKQEETTPSVSGYQPSNNYLAAFSKLPDTYLNRGTRPVAPGIKVEQEDRKPSLGQAPDYVPQPALVHAVQQFQTHHRPTLGNREQHRVKAEPTSSDRYSLANRSHDQRKRPLNPQSQQHKAKDDYGNESRKKVKREGR